MANRGRGRGKASMSINVEQLGFGRGEALPGPVLQPPPKYPTLDYKPIPFVITEQVNYLLEIKRDYAEFLRDTPAYVQPIVVNKDIERYSDWFQDMIADKTSYEELYDWSVIPAELKPSNKRRKRQQDQNSKNTSKKKSKDMDVESKLKELERKENNQRSDVEEDGKDEDGDNEDDEKEPEERPEEEEEELDEEMDDGTDYVNSYFDNGEGFDDEDDNLDDGPVY